MARLPIPGSDNNTWGDVLNDYLAVSHDTDGTIKPNAVDSSAIQDNSVSGAKLQDDSVTNAKLNTGSGGDGQVLTKDSGSPGGFAWTSVAGSPDAAPGVKGLIALNGDLGGSAATPTVPALANKANSSTTITAGTGLTGGGDLSANRTISANVGTGAGTLAAGNDSRIVGAEQTANKAVANGYASLNASTRVPTAQLGSGTADSTSYLRGDGTWTVPPTAPVTSVAGKTGAVTLVSSDVGLGNVDNTSDANKPVSTAQQTALNLKADKATTITAGTGLTGGGDLSANRTLTVSYGTTAGTAAQGNDSRITGAEQTVNKGTANGYASLNSSTRVPTAQLGSGTADSSVYLRGDGAWAAAPTAPVTSVAGKTGVVTLVKGDVGLGNVDNTSDANKPVSTAQQTALDGKVNVINGGGETFHDNGSSSTAATLDLALGNVHKLTLTANCTITLTGPATGAYRSMLILLFQDGTGSRTVTWPGSVKWGTAGTPTLSTGAGKMDKILLDTVDGGTNWYGSLGPGGY